MAYPSLPQSYDSRETKLTGIKVDRATNGKAKSRSFFGQDWKVFTVVHDMLTQAEVTTLEAFWASNKLTTFTFVWSIDGLTYNVVFGEGDLVKVPLMGNYFQITVNLAQV